MGNAIFNRINSKNSILNDAKSKISSLESNLKSLSMINKKNIENTIQNSKIYSNNYNLYVADKDGHVIYSSSEEVKSIDVSKFKIGKLILAPSKHNSNTYNVYGCDHLKNNYYLYFNYSSLGHNDNLVLLCSIILFIIIFSFLIKGRVHYILEIKKHVNKIADGNLSCRVPLKYKDELKYLSEDINSMAAALEKEDIKRSKFLTNISHDLRTPLTTILGYVNMIKNEKYSSKDELIKYINIIDKKGNFLKKMLDDFFEYSKLSSNDIRLEKQNLDLNELIRSIVYEESDVFKKNGFTISLNLPEIPIHINADSKFLYRAINNLINNAQKYSKKNTKIEIDILKEDKNAVISISNIPKDKLTENDLNSFFDRLYKKDSSRNSPGSGLGLSIAKDIIRLHGGFIKTNLTGNKLSFKIYIPDELTNICDWFAFF